MPSTQTATRHKTIASLGSNQMQYGSDRRLARALKHVEMNWFPMNHETCARAKALTSIHSDNEEFAIYAIPIIKQDFALFSHC